MPFLKKQVAGKIEAPKDTQSFLIKYWYIFLPLAIISFVGGQQPPQDNKANLMYSVCFLISRRSFRFQCNILVCEFHIFFVCLSSLLLYPLQIFFQLGYARILLSCSSRFLVQQFLSLKSNVPSIPL